MYICRQIGISVCFSVSVMHESPCMYVARHATMCAFVLPCIWTQFNPQCDQKHWYTYISHYCQMPLNKEGCHIAHFCPTALLLYATHRLHTQVKNKLQLLFTELFPTKKFPLKWYICNIWKLVHMQIQGNYVSRYTSLSSMQSIKWLGTMVYIHFTLLMYGPKQIFLLHCTYVPLHFYCILHIEPTLLHTSIENQWTETFIYHTTAKYVLKTNMPFKYHVYTICQNYLTCTNGKVC